VSEREKVRVTSIPCKRGKKGSMLAAGGKGKVEVKGFQSDQQGGREKKESTTLEKGTRDPWQKGEKTFLLLISEGASVQDRRKPAPKEGRGAGRVSFSGGAKENRTGLLGGGGGGGVLGGGV